MGSILPSPALSTLPDTNDLPPNTRTQLWHGPNVKFQNSEPLRNLTNAVLAAFSYKSLRDHAQCIV